MTHGRRPRRRRGLPGTPEHVASSRTWPPQGPGILTGMTDQNDIPLPAVWLTLRARNARDLIRFLVDAFGFEQSVVFGDGDQVAHAELLWPLGGGVMLASAGDAPDGSRGEDDPWALRPGSAGAYVVTDAADELFERAVAAGAAVINKPHDTEYGSREFAVRDPEGNRWSFGTYRGEPRRR
jgi:uncharacterized glyoxalase superfamily protein PhnB